MNITELLADAMTKKISDIFIVAGCAVSIKINDVIVPANDVKLMPEDTYELIKQIYAFNPDKSIDRVMLTGDDDFSFSIPHVGRFRCNTYKQRNSLAAVLRVLSFDMPDPSVLKIPEIITNLSKKEKGLVLITGSAGSGKSTTLSCIINQINNTKNSHIITIEDPIEFIHRHNKSIVSQREIQSDTNGYVEALRAALRQSPNVILLGEMRDFETISTAVTAAETGQFVLSTLHTIGASKTIDRIIDVFPQSQQQQIRIQLSMVLEAVISQQLLPTVDGKLTPAFEIMIANSAIRNMIREAKVHQIDNTIFSSSADGMITMDTSILKLYTQNIISKETALTYCTNLDQMTKKIAALG